MIIAPNSTIKGVLTGLVRASSNEALTSPTDYEILSNDWVDASLLDGEANQIQLEDSPAFDYSIGDMIEVRETTGDNYPIIARVINIAQGGYSLLLEDDLRDEQSGNKFSGSMTLEVRSLEQRTSIKDIDEGYYIIQPSNLKLVVRDNYITPALNLSDLFARYPDARNLDRADLVIIEQTALKDIYSQLSGYDNYFDIVDEIDMERLLLFKTICIIHMRSNETENEYCKMFKVEMNKYLPDLKYTADPETGEITSTVAEKVGTYAEFSL